MLGDMREHREREICENIGKGRYVRIWGKGDMRERRERRKQKLRFLVCPGKKTGSTNLQMPLADIGIA